MLDRDTATAAAEALTHAIIALFEEALSASVEGASGLAEYSERTRVLRDLTDDAALLIAALRTLAARGTRGPGG